MFLPFLKIRINSNLIVSRTVYPLCTGSELACQLAALLRRPRTPEGLVPLSRLARPGQVFDPAEGDLNADPASRRCDLNPGPETGSSPVLQNIGSFGRFFFFKKKFFFPGAACT